MDRDLGRVRWSRLQRIAAAAASHQSPAADLPGRSTSTSASSSGNTGKHASEVGKVSGADVCAAVDDALGFLLSPKGGVVRRGLVADAAAAAEGWAAAVAAEVAHDPVHGNHEVCGGQEAGGGAGGGALADDAAAAAAALGAAAPAALALVAGAPTPWLQLVVKWAHPHFPTPPRSSSGSSSSSSSGDSSAEGVPKGGGASSLGLFAKEVGGAVVGGSGWQPVGWALASVGRFLRDDHRRWQQRQPQQPPQPPQPQQRQQQHQHQQQQQQ